MGTPQKFALPSPNFNKKVPESLAMKPHFLTPSGMTLHARHQPPPMYGKRGATYPGKFLQKTNHIKFTASVVQAAAIVEPQFCEACDMELQSMDDLRRHTIQHEKCPFDNCNYSGHPSVMDKHVTTLHNSGLFDKFKKLSSPEEIAAWREERKRKYPTLENSLMRQRAKEQREKRGERLEANKSRFGKYDDRKKARNNVDLFEKPQKGKQNQPNNVKSRDAQTTRKNNKRRRKQEKQKLEQKKQNEQIEKIKTVKKETGLTVEKEEIERSCDGVLMFKGTSGLSDYQHVKPKKPTETNVLSGLLGMYGSDNDSEEDTDEDERLNESEDFSKDYIKSEEEIKSAEHTENSVDKESVNITASVLHGDEELLKVVAVENKTEPESNFESSEQNPLKLYLENNLDNSADLADENADTSKNVEYSNDSTKKEFVCSDDEGPEEAPIARSIDLPMPIKRPQTTEPAEGTSNSVSNQPAPSKRTKLNQLHKRKSGLDYRKARLRKQNTLLEKLLEPDIRHERNVLLQCVRYVCENKFFGIGEKNKE
ncbi:nuclear fragile X mental retardation-interacting protein 1 [Rhagoletis pomonella]|uniref:nuclear fragile X mental retardation-interacting protein 1 n=1 Tax=Rhagoletis pomonella TaxID=28610 RepID=UPI00177D521E|nr:nuclear fragile X mental retardation-interacting protein 1 [Rhagoletis pomonella]